MPRSRRGGREGYPHSTTVDIRKFTEAQRQAIGMIGFTSAVLSDRTWGNPVPWLREAKTEVAELLRDRGYVRITEDGNAVLTEAGMEVHKALYPWLHDEEFMSQRPTWREQEQQK